MKGLLLKDLYMMKKYGMWNIIIALLFIVASLFGYTMFDFFYPCLVCSMIPMSIISYDEKSRWDQYCGTLPFTKTQIVSSKYIMGLLVQMTVILINIIAHGIKMCVIGDFQLEYLMMILTTNVLASIFPSICLPLVFKFGAEKGRVIAVAIMGLILAQFAFVNILTIQIISSTYNEHEVQMKFDTSIFVVGCLVAAVVYAISWLLSVALYKKREIS